MFSPDGSHFAYFTFWMGKPSLIIDGEEEKHYDDIYIPSSIKYFYRYRRLGIPFSVPLSHGIERNFQWCELNQI